MWIVMTSTAKMPSSCWGTYRRIALVRLTPDYAAVRQRPRMISDRARGVAELKDLGHHHVGKTRRGAYQRELVLAELQAAALNAREGQWLAQRQLQQSTAPALSWSADD